MKRKEILKRVIGRHNKNCVAVTNKRRGTWSTEWAHAMTIFSDEHFSTVWLEFRCNDHDCPAKLRVSQDWILKLIGEGK